MQLPMLSGEFRLVADPELRFTQSGMAVTSVRLVADKQKRVEKPDGSVEWVDDKVCWLNGTVWGRAGGDPAMAGHVAESLRSGDLVVITGDLETRSFETRDGEKRTSLDVTIRSIGPSLRWRDVLHSDGKGGKVTREGAAAGTPPMDNDPWATAAPADQPPF